jgi:adenylosuccinate lyase
MNDDNPTASRVPDPGIRKLFTIESRWQAWLEVEAALARAEAEIGMIPAAAAEAITAKARLELMDRQRIDEGFARTAHTIVPLVWELSRIVGEPHGGWVHWGATTQNIVDCGDLLILRQVDAAMRTQLGALLEALAELAERGAELPMAGRTHGQHAVPITFGFKVAGWIDQLVRHIERMDQMAPRLFSAVLGGAAGTFASFGEQGPAAQAALARQLRMHPVDVPSRAIADRQAENICLMGLLAATASRIAREVYLLMKTEIGEVEEPVPAGTVGSSTMPQKRNPKLAQDVVALAAEVRTQVPLALEAAQTEHEADRTTSLMMRVAESRACIATGDLLARLVLIMSGLTLNPARMRSNLDVSGGLIMAESVMLKLGEKIGRQHAHDAVYAAAQEAAITGQSFSTLLAKDRRVSDYLDQGHMEALLDPTAYTGRCADMARTGAERARLAAGAIKQGLAAST